MLGRPSMRAASAGSSKKFALDEGDIGTSIYEGAQLEKLRGMQETRKTLIKKVRRLTDRIRRQMAKNATINGSWYKLFKNYDKNNSGDITFDELRYVVYKELEVSKLEMAPRELRLVWSVLDRNGDNSVTIEEFASFMRRLESNKIDHVIVEAVDKQLVEGFRSPPPVDGGTPGPETRRANSPSRGSFGDAASVRTAPVSPTALPREPATITLRHSHSDGSIATWLRSYRTIGGYSSLGRNRGFQMGRPPEDNESVKSIVPRLEYNFSARQLQRMKFGERLSHGGGERYPLMDRARTADRLFESDDGQPVFRSLSEVTAASSSPLGGTAPILPLKQDSHWSMRLANIPTHSTLSRQHSKFMDIKMKFKMH